MNRFVLSIMLLFFHSVVMASDQYINIISPHGNVMIDPDNPVTVSGTGKGMFEGNVVIRFEDQDGNMLVQKPTTMRRDDIAAAGDWQTSVTLPRPVPESVRLIAFSPSPKEGEAAITSAPVMLVTGNAIEPTLEGVRWRLSEYLGESGKLQPVNSDTVIDVQFAGGKVTGSAGCNRYFGGYTSGPEGRLVIGKMGSTQMACAQAVASQEHRYLVLLASTGSADVGADLLLRDKQGQVVLKYMVEPSVTLENTHWQAQGVNNGRGGVVTSAVTQRATALFTDGKVSGSAGCNNYSASYEISDAQITIGPAMTTRKQCDEPEGVMALEQEFLQALAAASKYQLLAERLELRDSNGSLQVRFVIPAVSE
jgi:heat shock protein HslJ